MKCNQCGKENQEGAKFCIYCGAKLTASPVTKNKDELIHLASVYTGSLSCAEQIVQDTPNDIRSVSQACVQWIKAHDASLFTEAGEVKEGAVTLDTVSDIDKAVRDLDYEERITVLMHCIEKMQTKEIADILGIPEASVIYYLQSAYDKNYPPERPAPILERPKKQVRIKKQKNTKNDTVETKTDDDTKYVSKITWKMELVVAVIIAVILGCFFGIKSYASNQFDVGVSYLDAGEYDEAIEPLLNAKRYGGNVNAGLRLGDAYAGQGEYEKALEEYKECTSSDEVTQALISTYGHLADEAVSSSNYGHAQEYLQAQYDLDQDEHTYIRLMASENEGSYEDDNGNVYNAWGNPTKLTAQDSVYQVDITYDDDQKFSSMKEYVSEGTLKTTFNKFEDASTSDLYWIMQKDKPVTYSYITTQTDDEGNITEKKILNQDGSTNTTYQYTYSDGHITEAEVTTGDETSTDTYEYNGTLLTTITHGDGSITEFKYDRNNQCIRETVKTGLFSKTAETIYTYDTDGNVVTQTIVSESSVDGLPFSTKESIDYTYTASGQPYTMTITANDSEVAHGYYVQNNGWVVLYNTVETTDSNNG